MDYRQKAKLNHAKMDEFGLEERVTGKILIFKSNKKVKYCIWPSVKETVVEKSGRKNCVKLNVKCRIRGKKIADQA